MKNILKGFYGKSKNVSIHLWNLPTKNPQFKDWAVFIALIISVVSFNNSIKNTQKAETTFKSNLQKDSINMSNLKEINSNTKNQTEIIGKQLELAQRQLTVFQQQLKVTEKSVEEQINRGSPQYSLNQDAILYIDSLGIGIGKGNKSYKLKIKSDFHFVGIRTAYNVKFRRFYVINDEITMEDLYGPVTILDVITNDIRNSFSNCRYSHKVNNLLLITEVTWLDKFLNKPHSDTSYSEYDKQNKIFLVCNSKVKNDLFNNINSFLKKKDLPKLRPNY